jgi:hypothetical protein
MERGDERHAHEPPRDREREGKEEREREVERERKAAALEKVERDPEGKAPQLEGGVVGAGAGLAMGVMGGPVGMVIGALAGAVGGWWAIDKITEGMGTYTDDEDRHYRRHYETSEHRLADRGYDDVRPAYVFGHLAARNPALAGRSFAEAEPELERDWTRALASKHGEWSGARRYAQAAFERANR